MKIKNLGKLKNLVKLLNKYEEVSSEELQLELQYKFNLTKDNKITIQDTIDGRSFNEFESECIIFSRGYEFIAWLVENKNSYLKEYEAVCSPYYCENSIYFEDGPTITNIHGNLYDSILGALAIDNNPLDLLLDLMKD